jgi:putative endonuclease
MGTDKQIKGRLGEDEAVRFLEKNGYRILERNFRCRHGEVDVIAEENGTIVFVEVKARTSDAFGAPEESVGRRKQERIIRASKEYLFAENLTDHSARFDVVSIEIGRDGMKTELIKNAFEAGE